LEKHFRWWSRRIGKLLSLVDTYKRVRGSVEFWQCADSRDTNSDCDHAPRFDIDVTTAYRDRATQFDFNAAATHLDNDSADNHIGACFDIDVTTADCDGIAHRDNGIADIDATCTHFDIATRFNLHTCASNGDRYSFAFDHTQRNTNRIADGHADAIADIDIRPNFDNDLYADIHTNALARRATNLLSSDFGRHGIIRSQ
jgi:hypothetical protein